MVGFIIRITIIVTNSVIIIIPFLNYKNWVFFKLPWVHCYQATQNLLTAKNNSTFNRNLARNFTITTTIINCYRQK